MTDKTPGAQDGYTVVGTVDVTDRPFPNSDPNGKGAWGQEQEYPGDGLADGSYSTDSNDD